MPSVTCAVCTKSDDSSKMRYCNQCALWVHYSCAGGGTWVGNAQCPKCRKVLK